MKKSNNNQTGVLDNAFYDIKDKKSLNIYLDYLENWEDAIRLPLTIQMIARWKVKEAKKIFINYLSSDNRDLVFIGIDCLSYYNYDSEINELLINKLSSKDKDIALSAKKALKMIDKKKVCDE